MSLKIGNEKKKTMTTNNPSDAAIAKAFRELDSCQTHTYPECQVLARIFNRARDIDAAWADHIHSCSYYCTRPLCMAAQRDELRDTFIKEIP